LVSYAIDAHCAWDAPSGFMLRLFVKKQARKNLVREWFMASIAMTIARRE